MGKSDDNTIAAYVIVAAITSHFNYNSDNYYKRVRGWHTAKLFYPIAQKIASNNRMIAHGLDPYRPKFHGINPLTGLPITIVFNEPAPGREKLMNWNILTQCWFYSEDAGLTWEKVQYKEDFLKHLEKVDCFMETASYGY